MTCLISCTNVNAILTLQALATRRGSITSGARGKKYYRTSTLNGDFGIEADCITAVAKLEDRLLILLDLNKILSEEEQAVLE